MTLNTKQDFHSETCTLISRMLTSIPIKITGSIFFIFLLFMCFVCVFSTIGSRMMLCGFVLLIWILYSESFVILPSFNRYSKNQFTKIVCLKINFVFDIDYGAWIVRIAFGDLFADNDKFCLGSTNNINSTFQSNVSAVDCWLCGDYLKPASMEMKQSPIKSDKNREYQ